MSNQKGFSLLELMIAIVILGIALIPMTGMFTTAQLSIKQGSGYTEALGLAQQIMEEQKAKYLQQQALAPSETGTRDGFNYTVTVNDVDSEHKVKNVRVEVVYLANGNSRTVSLITRMGDWK